MSAQIKKLIRSEGTPVEVYNAAEGGGRSLDDYGTADGTIPMVIERRSMGREVTDSSGTTHEADIEFRAVPDDTDPPLVAADEGQPSKLEHPTSGTYRVMATHVEDIGVTVIYAIES